MFDDLVGESVKKITPAKKKMKVVDQAVTPKKGFGGVNESDEYSWSIRVLRDGASIVEIITTDELNPDDKLIEEVVKKLRRLSFSMFDS